MFFAGQGYYSADMYILEYSNIVIANLMVECIGKISREKLSLRIYDMLKSTSSCYGGTEAQADLDVRCLHSPKDPGRIAFCLLREKHTECNI